jgi:hypothetical protein
MWIGCEGTLVELIPTQVLRHRHISAANNTLVPGCFLHRRAEQLQDICAYMANKRPGDVRMFPSAEELEFSQQKVGDIRVLDQITECAPGRWSFRPITCDSTLGCHLYENTVLKRSHSCGSEHVKVHPPATDLSKYL